MQKNGDTHCCGIVYSCANGWIAQPHGWISQTQCLAKEKCHRTTPSTQSHSPMVQEQTNQDNIAFGRCKHRPAKEWEISIWERVSLSGEREQDQEEHRGASVWNRHTMNHPDLDMVSRMKRDITLRILQDTQRKLRLSREIKTHHNLCWALGSWSN